MNEHTVPSECATRSSRYFYCDHNAHCVQERSHLRSDILYYPNDPTCDNACSIPSPSWRGSVARCGVNVAFPRAKGYWHLTYFRD